MVKVYIDAGHGGHDPGALGNGLQEKSIVLSIALKMRDILQSNYKGVEVRLSRANDTFRSLSSRAADANAWGADAFVSIHCNSASNPAANGFETFRMEGVNDAKTVKLQNCVHDAIMNVLPGTSNRGKKSKNLAVLRETNMVAVLTENLFMNHAEIKQFNSSQFVHKIAEAHAKGIADFYGLTKVNSGGSGGSNTGLKPGVSVITITGQNVNLRKGPGTSYAVIRKLNAPESYVVWAIQNGWYNLGGDQWVYGDQSYTRYSVN
ncbi:N-acetylmuramoyl-L-alanine amidase [Bacillus wiedmannii]|uniref:N-acetylmuramoyl-L-alanine amidase n=1 Tax=Bacillus wiedmannii TaxID=1890302 RepID=UPI000BF21FB1|nr:N-acetylmuramoyl-L-alanine amidase [Bacillus wiedmannii]PEM08513.1 hypothetical protein CN610_19870 [Bacillus wiedmannii]